MEIEKTKPRCRGVQCETLSRRQLEHPLRRPVYRCLSATPQLRPCRSTPYCFPITVFVICSSKTSLLTVVWQRNVVHVDAMTPFGNYNKWNSQKTTTSSIPTKCSTGAKVNHKNTQATTKHKSHAQEGHEHRSVKKNISRKQVAAGVAMCQGNAYVMSHCPLKCD